MQELVSYVEFLVKSISKEEDLVKVNGYIGDEEMIIDIVVSDSDMGAVIGKSGRNASAIRTLVLAYAYTKKLGKVKINFESI